MSLAETERYLAETGQAPSESHDLAAAAAEEPFETTGEAGASQVDHAEEEIRDLGWRERDHVEKIPRPLVGGLSNEELWTLIRRFNKVCVVQTVAEVEEGNI